MWKLKAEISFGLYCANGLECRQNWKNKIIKFLQVEMKSHNKIEQFQLFYAHTLCAPYMRNSYFPFCCTYSRFLSFCFVLFRFFFVPWMPMHRQLTKIDAIKQQQRWEHNVWAIFDATIRWFACSFFRQIKWTVHNIRTILMKLFCKFNLFGNL